MTVATDASVRAAYSSDASGLVKVPEGVARPASREEVVAKLNEATRDRMPVTAAGGQTSTTAASITDVGIILSTRALDRVLDVDPVARTVRVEPGVSIGDLQRALVPHGLFFAPDPTSEHECTVGGAIACNASGPRTLRYGATRAHVRALTVALADGTLLDVVRPRLEKNTVGYPPVQDLVDWFIGSEGTLGVIVAAELSLLPRPAREVGMTIPFASDGDALRFVVAARESQAIAPRCLEYLDAKAARLALRAEAHQAGGVGAASAASARTWGANVGGVVYAEEAGETEPPLDAWLALAERFGAITDDIAVFEGESAIAAARRLRHAVPAGMHERAAPFLSAGGRRVSTDWAVPYPRLAEAIGRARHHARAAGIAEPVVFGHAGNGHPHCNYIARDAAEVGVTEMAVEATLSDVLAMGGTVAAEHGIGKVKRKWLPLQCSPTQQRLMRAIKRELDPFALLAPGNIL